MKRSIGTNREKGLGRKKKDEREGRHYRGVQGAARDNGAGCKQNGARREMASGRCVSNDTISRLPRSPLLWAVALRADVLFGVEQPNEQQAGVRNVAPDALPSDYHTKTHLCVCERERPARPFPRSTRQHCEDVCGPFFFSFATHADSQRKKARQ